MINDSVIGNIGRLQSWRNNEGGKSWKKELKHMDGQHKPGTGYMMAEDFRSEKSQRRDSNW